MPSIVFERFQRETQEMYERYIYGGAQDMRDIRDPQEVGELVIELVHRSERNISATAAADKVEGYILKNYGESNEDYIARCNLIAATKRNGTSG